MIYLRYQHNYREMNVNILCILLYHIILLFLFMEILGQAQDDGAYIFRKWKEEGQIINNK